MKKTALIFCGLILGLFLCDISIANAGKPIAFKISYSAVPDTAMGHAVNGEFKNFIEKNSNGKYSVSSYPIGSIGGFDTVYQRLQVGTIDFSIESTANYSAFIPELAIFDLPFLLPSSQKLNQFIDSEAGQSILDIVRQQAKGIIPFFYCSTGFRYFANRGNAWNTIADIQGKKNRTTASKLHVALINALGMRATPMTGSEILTGLQQGVIDSVDAELPFIVQARVLDVAPYLLQLDHIPVLYIGSASKRWWDKLDEEDKSLFTEGFKILAKEIRRQVTEQNDNLIRQILADGHVVTKFSPDEHAKAVESTRPVWDSLTDKQKAMLKIVTDEISQ